MTTELDLLDVALAEPEDATARLILADWCEENGSEDLSARGELLRVQCALAGWVPDHAERQALLAREQELLAAHAIDWLGPLYKHCTRYHFERGLACVS